MIIPTTRMEYFSDGIIAIAVTVMVLDIELTEFPVITTKTEMTIFFHMLPRFLIYLLSFVMLGIMWVNHHIFYQLIQSVKIPLLWHNLHLLFWLTLIPFATSIMGKYPSLPLPAAIYGFNMLMASLAFSLSRRYVARKNMIFQSKSKEIEQTIKNILIHMRMKINIGIAFYIISIPLSFVSLPLTYICFIIPALIYLIPEVVKNRSLSKALYNQLRKMHH